MIQKKNLLVNGLPGSSQVTGATEWSQASTADNSWFFYCSAPSVTMLVVCQNLLPPIDLGLGNRATHNLCCTFLQFPETFLSFPALTVVTAVYALSSGDTIGVYHGPCKRAVSGRSKRQGRSKNLSMCLRPGWGHFFLWVRPISWH